MRVNLSTVSTQIPTFAAGEFPGRAWAVRGRGVGKDPRQPGHLLHLNALSGVKVPRGADGAMETFAFGAKDAWFRLLSAQPGCDCPIAVKSDRR